MKEIFYKNIRKISNYEQFSSSIKINDVWNNEKSELGIIISPYYSLCSILNNKKIKHQVMAANVVQGLSSFACLTKTKNSTNLELSAKENINSVEIFNAFDIEVPYKINKNKIVFSIDFPTSYTFIINNDLTKAFTIFLQKNTRKSNINYFIIKPGIHKKTIEINKDNFVIFKSGLHKVKNIVLHDNSTIYFENGAYLEALNPSTKNEIPIMESDWAGRTRFEPFIKIENANHIKIFGNGIIDLSKLDFHARLGISIYHCKNVIFSNFLINNPPEWATFLSCSENIKIDDVKIFGYRQNSDAFAVVDSKNVVVSNCFSRSGDDLFEVKSMYGDETIKTSNITFRNCVAWPEKARGFGIIAETKRNIENVFFKNSIVINYPSKWMDALGSLIIYVENNGQISNIYFENLKIYHSYFYPINVTLAKGSNGNIKNIYFKNICFDNNLIRICNDSQSKIENLNFESVYKNNRKIEKLDASFKISGNIGKIIFR